MKASLAFSILCFAISLIFGMAGSDFGSGAAFAGGLIWLGMWLYDF